MRYAIAIAVGVWSIVTIIILVIKYFLQPPIEQPEETKSDNDISVEDMVLFDSLEPNSKDDPKNIWWKGK